MEQTGPDFGASVFEDGKAFAEVKRAMATLSALLVKPDSHSALASEPPQPAQQLVSGYRPSNKTSLPGRQPTASSLT
jgi:hypothetical protein